MMGAIRLSPADNRQCELYEYKYNYIILFVKNNVET